MPTKLIVVAGGLLLWPIISWVTVSIRFALLRDDAKKIDTMQKWGGDV